MCFGVMEGVIISATEGATSATFFVVTTMKSYGARSSFLTSGIDFSTTVVRKHFQEKQITLHVVGLQPLI